MKKYLLIASIATLGLSLTACGGKKGESAQSTENKQEVTTTVNENDVLARYETIIDKAIEIQEKVANGDVASVEELTKLAEEMTAISTELLEAAANFTPEQTLKYAELVQKWADASPKAE